MMNRGVVMADSYRYRGLRIQSGIYRSVLLSFLTLWQISGSETRMPAFAAQDLRPLDADRPIERGLSGGQSQMYEINVTAGQYLEIVVEQHGIDVLVRLLGPDGKEMAQVDSEIRNNGLEVVSQVVDAPGRYRVSVQA